MRCDLETQLYDGGAGNAFDGPSPGASAQSRYVAKIIDMRCNFFENSSISGGIQEAYLQKMTENCYGSNSRPVPASHSGKEDGKTIF